MPTEEKIAAVRRQMEEGVQAHQRWLEDYIFDDIRLDELREYLRAFRGRALRVKRLRVPLPIYMAAYRHAVTPGMPIEPGWVLKFQFTTLEPDHG